MSEIGHYMESTSRARKKLAEERARAGRLADRAVMLESRLAEVAHEAAEYLEWEVGDPVLVFKRILVVAEGES